MTVLRSPASTTGKAEAPAPRRKSCFRSWTDQTPEKASKTPPPLSPRSRVFRRFSAEAGGYLRFRSLYQHSPVGSVEQYGRTFDGLLSSLPSDRLDAFTSEAVHSWAMRELERGVGARTVHSRLAHLAALGDYLVKHRLLPENPLDHVERPRFKKRPSKFLFPEEVKTLLAAERPEHERVALALCLDTMLRVSELAGATVGDLEQTADQMFLRVVNTSTSRPVPSTWSSRCAASRSSLAVWSRRSIAGRPTFRPVSDAA